ncbi:MAG: hypothetical protein F6K04_02650 [Leptolyngbya sp. SIO4C5]|nr:hypothetical protein [Leptolyngbya sp. SIO4C5]
MSDTTAFLAGCATTGVAALLLVLARASVDETSPLAPNQSNAFPEEAMAPPLQVPPPPLPQTANSNLEDQLRRELESQQDTTSDLEGQLQQQELLIRTLEEKLDNQQQETRTTLAQLQDYQQSLQELSLSQSRSPVVERSETQTLVLWLGAGFLLALILGGGVVLIVLLIMMSQSQRRQSRSAQMMYPVTPPPPPYRYYEQEFLPPPALYPRRSEAHNPYDFR